MKLTLGLYGLFFFLVALNGNAGPLVTDLKADMGHFLPWLIVAAVLGGLYDYDYTHAFALAFLLLVILGFMLMNFSTLKAEAQKIYSGAVGTAQGMLKPTGS
jgi:hypothetical protein